MPQERALPAAGAAGQGDRVNCSVAGHGRSPRADQKSGLALPPVSGWAGISNFFLQAGQEPVLPARCLGALSRLPQFGQAIAIV
jgi:hypothetical protein